MGYTITGEGGFESRINPLVTSSAETMETTEAITGSVPAAAPAGIDLTLDINYGLAGGASEIVVAKPDSTVDGDFLLAALAGPSGAGGTTITPPSGWTQLATIDNGDYRLRVWYKRASTEGASWTWTTAGGTYSEVLVWRITGVVASGDPLDVAVSTDTGDGDITCLSITTATAGAAVIQFLGASNDINDGSPANGVMATTLTLRYSNGITLVASGDTQASAGASGNKTIDVDVERTCHGILLALKPAS